MSKSMDYKPDIVGSHRYSPSFLWIKCIRKAKATKQSISKNTGQDAHEPKKSLQCFNRKNHTNIHFHQCQRCPFSRPKLVSNFQASPALL